MSLHASVSNKTEETTAFDSTTQCECGSTRFIQTCYQTWTEEKFADTEEQYSEYQNQEFIETYEWGNWKCESCYNEVYDQDLLDRLEDM